MDFLCFACGKLEKEVDKYVKKNVHKTEMHRLLAVHLRYGCGFYGGGWLGSYTSALPQPW